MVVVLWSLPPLGAFIVREANPKSECIWGSAYGPRPVSRNLSRSWVVNNFWGLAYFGIIPSTGCVKCVYNCAHQFSAEKTSTRGREVDLKIFQQNIFGQKMA